MKQIKGVFIIFLIICSLFALKISANQPVYNSNKDESVKIAVTFDDGPHPKRTLKLLEILNKHNIKATFFVIGQNVKNYPDVIRKIVENGHEIANHTYSHKILKNMKYENVENEIRETEEIVSKKGGSVEKIIRPPCGLYDNSLVRLAEEKGYKIVLWSIDTHDWERKSAKEIENNIINNTKGGDIILFHDYTSGENHTVEALDKIIPILKEKGLEFVTVSQLLQK